MLSRFFKKGKDQGDQPPENQPPSASEQAQPTNPAQAPAQGQTEAAIPSPPAGPRMVYCAKLKQRLPGLDRPPVSGELGQRIYDNISAAAWDMWKRQAVMLVNHYGLIGVDPDARKWLNEQMEAFLFEDEEQVPEGWAPEGQGGGKGAPTPAKGGAAPSKGAPAAPRK